MSTCDATVEVDCSCYSVARQARAWTVSINPGIPLLRRLECHSTCLIYVIKFCRFMYIQGLHRTGTKELWSLHDHFVKCKPEIALWLQSTNFLCTILQGCIPLKICILTHLKYTGESEGMSSTYEAAETVRKMCRNGQVP